MNDVTLMSGAPWDAQALSALKQDAIHDPKGSLKQVALQMEGLFVQMMLKSMRAALPKDDLFNSEATQLYTTMYDQQISQQLSQKGLGLADMMVKQLSVSSAEPDESAGNVPLLLENEVLQVWPLQKLDQLVQKAMPRFVSPESGAMATDNGMFMARLSIPALVASQKSGIPHQLIVAQAALESGWGVREIPAAAGKSSYNLFGVKSGSNWAGPVSDIITTEYEQGIARKIKASFRVYGSYTEAVNDYVRLLTENPRYAQVLTARDPEQAAHALQQAGYATDPQYADKLTRVINSTRLRQTLLA